MAGFVRKAERLGSGVPYWPDGSYIWQLSSSVYYTFQVFTLVFTQLITYSRSGQGIIVCCIFLGTRIAFDSSRGRRESRLARVEGASGMRSAHRGCDERFYVPVHRDLCIIGDLVARPCRLIL